MAKKSWTTRWTDTTNYLNRKFPVDRLGDHVKSLVTDQKGVSEQLSLGTFHARGSDDKRHAMRALLLCQRVYYSDLWAKRTWDLTTYVNDTMSLNPAWKKDSLSHWGNKGEHDIVQGIAMFAPVAGASRQDLVTTAKAGPPNGEKKDFLPGNLTLSRSDLMAKGAADTCYNGVTAWLLKSGIVSMRWFMRDSAPNGQNACDRLFGTGEVVWPPDQPFRDDSVLPAVGAGYIVHMWLEDSGPGGWNGHWVISNGDGTICGVNNGEVKTTEETVLKKYTNSGRLRTQFEGYGGLLTKDVLNDRGFIESIPIDPPKYGRASMVKFDPLTLPNLL
ncbi:MAG: hypothetical protein AB7F88_13585 [Pyrinomonadaceae bacterium]